MKRKSRKEKKRKKRIRITEMSILYLAAALGTTAAALLTEIHFLILSFVFLTIILKDIQIRCAGKKIWIPFCFILPFVSLRFEHFYMFLLLSAIWVMGDVYKNEPIHRWGSFLFRSLSWMAFTGLLVLCYIYRMSFEIVTTLPWIFPVSLMLVIGVAARKFLFERIEIRRFFPAGVRPLKSGWIMEVFSDYMFAFLFFAGATYLFHSMGWYGAILWLALYCSVAPFYLLFQNQKRDLEHYNKQARQYALITQALARAIETRDSAEFHHLDRVRYFAARMGEEFKLSGNEIEALELSATLHDIGKLAIPGYILTKPGRLESHEYQKIMKHPEVGVRILEEAGVSASVLSMIRFHHENFDGSGYPRGLKGDEIPLGSRILSAVDCYDILTHPRPYRTAWSHAEAMKMLTREAGRKFDPHVVETFTRHLGKWQQEIRQKISERGAREDVLGRDVEKAGEEVCREASALTNIASGYKDIYALYELAETTKGTWHLKKSLTGICNKIARTMPFSCCIIYFFRAEDRTLRPVYITGADQTTIRDISIHIGEKLSGWVAAHKKPIKMSGICSDFDSIPSESQDRVKIFRSALSAPLIVEETLIGVITLYETRENEYTDENLQLLDMISHKVADTLYHCLMTGEVQMDSLTDSLTGLPNVSYLFEMLNHELKKAHRHNSKLTLLGMDLDGLKRINDTYGMEMGDKILVKVSNIFKEVFRAFDTCVRYAGDEFYVVLPGVGKEEAPNTIERIQHAIDHMELEPWQEAACRVGVSVGTAFFPEDGLDMETLISVAHSRLYQAKHRKKSLQADPVL